MSRRAYDDGARVRALDVDRAGTVTDGVCIRVGGLPSVWVQWDDDDGPVPAPTVYLEPEERAAPSA